MKMPRVRRRTFISELSRGTFAVAVLGVTAVSCASESTQFGGSGDLSWSRVNLGFVSAYILIRGGRVAVVDTGVAGSEGDIAAGLRAAGAGWDSVDHLILTHLHGDHIGSVPAVMSSATGASAYAGAADIPAIESPRPVQPVGDGDEVLGLQIIETPGHTPGHISAYDPDAGVLVAGDSMNGADGGVIGANPRFTADMEAANASISKMALLEFETLLFGHGEPVLEGAGELVRRLAESL